MARFLIRILCSLALVLAAWPAGASAAPCVQPVQPVKPAKAVQHRGCNMPCCDKAPSQAMACHPTVQVSEAVTEMKAQTSCPCEFKAAPPVVLPSEKATLQTLHLDFALPPAPLAIATAGILGTDPVVLGGDSSPPGEAQRRPSSPRAPPVVRV